MAGGCTRISGALTSARASAAEMLSETERVSRDLAASETRSKLVDAFLQQYQLSPDEVAALQVRTSSLCQCQAGEQQHKSCLTISKLFLLY